MTGEYRHFELRADEGERVLSGVAMAYGVEATGLPFRERFEAGAFGDLRAADVILDVAHDGGRVLARTGGGGMTLTDTPERLSMRAELPDTTEARDVWRGVQAGLWRGLSVHFEARRERMAGDLRIIEGAELRGIAVVARAAYDATTLRAREAARSASPLPLPRVWL